MWQPRTVAPPAPGPRDTAEWGITDRKAIGSFHIKEFAQPPHRRLPWHVHEHASICFVARGSYREVTRGRETVCPPRAMVFKPAAERHADQFGIDGGTCLLIEIAPDRLGSIAPYARITEEPRVVRHPRLVSLGYRVYQEFTAADAWSPLAIEGLILEVLAEASRAVVRDPTPRAPAWLQQVRELLHDNFRDPISLASVALIVGVHPSHLARTFSKRYRTTIGEYVRRLRLECATRELAESSTPLSAIALGLGFFDQAHFSRLFKQHTGLTPSQVRSAARGRNGRPSRRAMS